jgi:outer membrane protein assembly factor BamB
MSLVHRLVLVALLGSALAGCTSSGNSVTCSFADPPTFPTPASSWPKFHHDRQNTGRIDEVRNLPPALQSAPRWMLAASQGGFGAGPALSQSDALVYIGGDDGSMYVVNARDDCTAGTLKARFVLAQASGFTSTALVGMRDGKDAIFVGGQGGTLFGIDADGVNLLTNWPAGIAGVVTASPNLSLSTGAVYIGSQDGTFESVCPNGIQQFSIPTSGFSSSPAVGPDGSVYFGADDGRLRAYDSTGFSKWAFAASAPISTAPVVEIVPVTGGGPGPTPTPITAAIYVADSGGSVFKVTSTGGVFGSCSLTTSTACRVDNQCPTGEQCVLFDFVGQNGGPVGAIHSSPALAGNHLYFGSDDGNLYAIDTRTGAIVWQVLLSAREIVSSPAVATKNMQQDRVVVVGTKEGNIYFVADNGLTAGAPQSFNVGGVVRSSPAIDMDGTVYVAADNGNIYALGAPLACGGTPTPSPSPTQVP